MISASLRDDEQASLAALQALAVLDTPAEPEFDALVRAASMVCGTPISLISLVDTDRQWFKANLGLEGIEETPRSVAFCAHAVLGDGIFEIPDASTDSRFADNPLVVGHPGIRFYAGVPISLAAGERVGALCVIDGRPKQLRGDQREVLVLLATAAAKALEGRRARRRLEEALDSKNLLSALIESERTLLRTLLAAIPELVWLKDGEGVYLACNLAFEKLFGASAADIVGKTDFDFMSPAQAEALRRNDRRAVLAGAPTVNEEWATFAHGGQRVLLETTKTPMRDDRGVLIGILGIAHDITEHRRYRDHLEEVVAERTAALREAHAAAEAVQRASQERLVAEQDAKMQSRKLEAVGTMAAGIAHEFNNILATIVGHAELAEDELPPGSSARNNVAKVIRSSFRARDLIARILTFSRKDVSRPQMTDLVAHVQEALDLLRVTLNPAVELRFRSSLAEPSPCVLAEPSQIMQIVMNLCINSAHAMEDSGAIHITLDPASGPGNGDRPVEGSPTGARGVCLGVRDTGTGMSPAVLERMFDPFFTTKAPGEGSGLGMSVVYGIVTGLGGSISARSEVGGANPGTEVRVFLPTVERG